MAECKGILVIAKEGLKRIYKVYYLYNRIKGYEDLFNALDPHYWVVVEEETKKNKGYHKRSMSVGEMMVEKKLYEREGFLIEYDSLEEDVKEIGTKEMCVLGLK